jgi:hypothetical protein
MELDEIIELFNDGELDVEKYFNGYSNFFSILRKRGLLSQIDPEAPDSDEWQNDFLIWLYSNDKEKFVKYVQKFLGDIEIVNDIPYLVVNTRGELSKLFCSYRNELSSDTVEAILDGENDWGYYDNTTDDVYRDVIEELTKENLRRLKEYIIDTLKGKQIPTSTEVLESIAQSQGNDYVTVDESNIDEIVDDKETMEELMDDELIDLKGELYSVHSGAYNSAYEDDLYETIWDKLEEFFQGPGEWLTRPHVYKKDTEVQKFRVPIHNFYSNILEYLQDNKKYGNTGTLEYQGGYLEILKEWWECLKVWAPDYPDSRRVDKNINSYFTDYI